MNIINKYKLCHLSTGNSWVGLFVGDMLRAVVSSGSKLGMEVKSILDEGRLVSDDIVCDIVKENLDRPGGENGFLFDGFPRTVEQAKKVKKYEIFN